MCPVNLWKSFLSIGVLDNNHHNPTSVTGLFKKQALVFFIPKKENEGTSRQAFSPNSRSSILTPKSKIDFQKVILISK